MLMKQGLSELQRKAVACALIQIERERDKNKDQRQ